MNTREQACISTASKLEIALDRLREAAEFHHNLCLDASPAPRARTWPTHNGDRLKWRDCTTYAQGRLIDTSSEQETEIIVTALIAQLQAWRSAAAAAAAERMKQQRQPKKRISKGATAA